MGADHCSLLAGASKADRDGRVLTNAAFFDLDYHDFLRITMIFILSLKA